MFYYTLHILFTVCFFMFYFFVNVQQCVCFKALKKIAWIKKDSALGLILVFTTLKYCVVLHLVLITSGLMNTGDFELLTFPTDHHHR